jgi:hypothetical protein
MTDCELFLERVNAVLDGEAAASELASDHAQTCRDCRELAAAARLLASAGPALRVLPTVPAGLTPKLVTAMTRRRRRVWLPALAACVAVFGGAWFLRPVGPAVPDVATQNPSGAAGPTKPTPVPRVADQFAAVASVARSASEKATAPARLLSAPNLKLAAARPAADPLATLNTAGKTAAAPVADTTRRAVGLFLRDLGLSAKPAG